jgi:peptidyl-prolyl cis-trans isomerase A (cyclophilin A)
MVVRARRLSGFFPLLALAVAAAWFLGHAHIRAARAADPGSARQPVPDQPVPKQPDGKTPAPPEQAQKFSFVQMSTSHGEIYLELDQEKAPITVKNFLSYVDRRSYDRNIFHRVIPNFMIQGGGFTPDLTEQKGDAPIKNEWTNGLKNLRGTIAMARETEPDSATREFFINVVDNPRLDMPRSQTGNAGYAVFGRVIAGMSSVDTIKSVQTGTRQSRSNPAEEMKDVPIDPVLIKKVVRVSQQEAQKAVDEESGKKPKDLPKPEVPPKKPDAPPGEKK